MGSESGLLDLMDFLDFGLEGGEESREEAKYLRVASSAGEARDMEEALDLMAERTRELRLLALEEAGI